MEARYNINFERLGLLKLPFSMRSNTIKSLFRAAFSPFSANGGIMERFKNGRMDDAFLLAHNGQVCYLRKALNAKFKASNGVTFDILENVYGTEWLYASKEQKNIDGSDVYSHIYAAMEGSTNEHIYAPNELTLNTHNSFVVLVPSELYNDKMLIQIKNFVNTYRLVTRKPTYERKNS